MNWRDLRLVSGYLPEIDQPPEAALKLNLTRRVAVVVNDNDIPHSRFYWDLLEAIVESLPGECVTFDLNTGQVELSFDAISQMRAYSDGQPDLGIPFDSAHVRVRNKTVAYIQVEPWNMLGGPYPYHDTWTFAIYRAIDDLTRLRDACYRVCREHEIPIAEEMQGLPHPEPTPFWKRLVRWLLP